MLFLTVLIIAAMAWDFGRRWLLRQDYRQYLDSFKDGQALEIQALKATIDENKTRADKAIANLTGQTQEVIRDLEKKQNALLSGGMLRQPPSQIRR